VQEKMAHFFGGLKDRIAEVQRRCRTALQALAEGLAPATPDQAPVAHHVDLTCASV